MAVLDATTLLHFLEPGVQAATDPATGEPVADAEARIERLVHDLQQAKETVLIPTPALSEVLVHAGEAAPDYLELLHNTARFRIVPFGERAAVELAAMTREALAKGDLRAGTTATRAKLKFDRQIIAIARVEEDSTIYSDDGDIRRLARGTGADRHTNGRPATAPPFPERPGFCSRVEGRTREPPLLTSVLDDWTQPQRPRTR